MRFFIAFVALMAAAHAQEPAMRIIGEAELTGRTYKKITVGGSRVSACSMLCEEDNGCAAFTVASASSSCELKSSAGTTLQNRSGFFSGIKEKGGASRQSDRERFSRIPDAELEAHQALGIGGSEVERGPSIVMRGE